MRNPKSYKYPVVYETVEGAWADNVLKGDASLEASYIAAAKRAVERGAVAICGNCEFSIRYQQAVAEAVNVPVALSSLMLLPQLNDQIPRSKKLAIVTADSKCLTHDLIGLCYSGDRSRYVVRGVEGGTMWKKEMMRPTPPTTVPEILEDVISCLDRLLEAEGDIGAVLFECTLFPMASDEVRKHYQLPVYDMLSLCDLTYQSVKPRY